VRRPVLILGLGNPLMGDDGVAWHLVERLRTDPRLPADVEVAWGGSDLLACAGLMEGRRRVVLVDAVEGGEPGAVVELDPWSAGLDERDAGAHGLAVPGALRLLRAVSPALAELDLALVGVVVSTVTLGPTLSAPVRRRLPRITTEILDRAACHPGRARRPGGDAALEAPDRARPHGDAGGAADDAPAAVTRHRRPSSQTPATPRRGALTRPGK
jgi:hydrogenase maturation protease